MEACSYDLLELRKRRELDETAVQQLYGIFHRDISENGAILQN
jgi:hypothetical protein